MNDLIAPPLRGLLELIFRLTLLFVALPFAIGLLAGFCDYCQSKFLPRAAGTLAGASTTNRPEGTPSQTKGGR